MLFLAVPAAWIGWWIYVSETSVEGRFEMTRSLLRWLPESLQRPETITVVLIAFMCAAMVQFFKGLDERGFPMFVNLVLLGFSGLVTMWLLVTVIN